LIDEIPMGECDYVVFILSFMGDKNDRMAYIHNALQYLKEDGEIIIIDRITTVSEILFELNTTEGICFTKKEGKLFSKVVINKETVSSDY
jgi:hypothetical protein